MLTADLVTVRRRGDELRLPALDDDERARAAELATAYLVLAREHIGRSRHDLDEAWQAIPLVAREQRLAAGVRKLVTDRCAFSAAAADDSVALRAALFAAAARVRRALPDGGEFDRAQVVASVAQERGGDPAAIDAALYADLHGAEILTEVGPLNPVALAARYELAQAQGVLLRAVRVTAVVRARQAGQYRALFSKLKFLRLLYAITPLPRGGYQIDLDGPFSLFQSVTRYGLQLGLALPTITACDAWQIEADVLWGRDRKPLHFRWTGQAPDDAAPESAPVLADEVAALLTAVAALDGPWRAQASTEIFTLPGIGLCVPDLEFHHRETGARAYLEVLGFWSREAVWRRVDLVKAGLPHPILFAVGKQLRVSEAALDGDLPGALYVYARTMNAKTVIQRIASLASAPSAK